MSKTRVYEIAKELNLDSRTVVSKLQALGLDVRSHASSLDADQAARFIASYQENHKSSIVEKRVSKGIIRRRARSVEHPSEASDEFSHEIPAPEEESVPVEPEETLESNAAEPEEDMIQPIPDTKSVEPQDEIMNSVTEIPLEIPTDAADAATLEIERIEVEPETEPLQVATETKTPEILDVPKAPEKETEAAAPTDKESTAQQQEKKPPLKEKPAKKETYKYQTKIIRRAVPNKPMEPAPRDFSKAPSSQQPPSQPGQPGKPSGIRVLKVVPGKEGRGHEFIDMSKQSKGKKKATVSKHQQADMKEQLFDAFSPAYTPGLGRRKKAQRKSGRKTAVTTPKAQKRVIKIESQSITASELARRMGVKVIEINSKLREMGEPIDDLRSDPNIDLATASMVAQEFDHQVQDISFKEASFLGTENESPEDRMPRPPVVTVMGHVDHGKTSILDAIRKTNVTEGEEGGITQHIGAYEVRLPQGSVTFIDTPGHEAFTAMRARGASITDIVVLVVAADDGIMPQTSEAIHHAQEAGVPIIVAVNKMDLPGVDPSRIKQSLTEYKLVPEEWGGDTMVIEVSAKTKSGLNDLLENILLQAELLELTANPSKKSNGTVIEARLDRGKGPVATLLVREGTLKKGDIIVVGTTFGRMRMMFDHDGKTTNNVTPGRPVQILGLNEVPLAGETFNVVSNEKEAKNIIQHRQEEQKAALLGQTARLNLQDFYEKLQGNEKLELKLVVKADVQGTAEAVKQAIEKLSTPKVGVKVIHHGVGAINETDVNLTSASKALLVGFNTLPDNNAKKLANNTGVEIRTYKVIYDLTEDIRKAQTGLLPSTVKENLLGRAEVRELFNVPKVGTVAGVSVLDGKILRNAMVRLVRDSVEVHKGRMSSLRRFKEDVREVQSGYECGIGLENYNDIKRGDIIEAFQLEEERPSL